MIKRIVGASLIFCLLVALVLASLGIREVRIGPSFLSYLRTCSSSMEEFKIEIPDIPFIPKVDSVGGIWFIINVVVDFFNAVIRILNVLLSVINVIISVIQFIVTMIINFEGLIKSLQGSVITYA